MGLKLAVVAGAPDFRAMMSDLLQSMECEVIPFDSGSALLQQLENARFGGVLLDLPPNAGEHLELTKRIRASSLNGQAPIALLSDPSWANEMKPAFEAGVNIFLSKPVHREALRRALNMFVTPIARKKRRYPRVPFTTNVLCRRDSFEARLSSINLSEVGILLEGGDALAFGDEIELQFSLPAAVEPLLMSGRVIRKDVHKRVAIAFINVLPSQQQRLQQFVNVANRDKGREYRVAAAGR
jgi:CheY-like chemotaxis protein